MQDFRGCLFVAGYALCLLLLNVIDLSVIKCISFQSSRESSNDRVSMKILSYTQLFIDFLSFSIALNSHS